MDRQAPLTALCLLVLAAACQPEPATAPCAAPPPAAAPACPAVTAQAVAPLAARAPGEIEKAYRDVASKIIDAAMKDPAAFQDLRFLSDRIGHRLSGSASLTRAIAWAERRLKEDGHENVRSEKVLVPHWQRGSERASLLAPEQRPLEVLGLGGSVPTPKGGISAEVLVVGSFEELASKAALAKDKIVLFDSPMAAFSDEKGSGYGDAVQYRSKGPSAAAKLGAKAVLIRSVTAHSLNTTHTGATNYDQDAPKIPAAALTIEGASQLRRLSESGEKVRVKLELDSRMLPDAESANVIAELRGRERPDEVVLIGAHIDSWDVGQGAHDDGAGCVMVMHALGVLRKMGLRPRRTIRVVLFTNEENGLRGALAYADAHKAELPNLVAAFEADIGGFDPRGLHVEAPKERLDAVLARTRDLAGLLSPLGVTRVQPGFSGADLIPLVKAGAVGLGLVTDHRTYFDIHHSAADTLDKVDPKSLARNVANAAVLSYVIADLPQRFDRPVGAD